MNNHHGIRVDYFVGGQVVDGADLLDTLYELLGRALDDLRSLPRRDQNRPLIDELAKALAHEPPSPVRKSLRDLPPPRSLTLPPSRAHRREPGRVPPAARGGGFLRGARHRPPGTEVESHMRPVFHARPRKTAGHGKQTR